MGSATFVLIHGGGHGGWCWQPVADLLRAEGHKVHAPTLTGLAERAGEMPVDIGLETHVAEVAALLEPLAPAPVVLVGHSYGGMVICGAADRAAGRVARLVFLDAAIAEQGEALIDISLAISVLAEDVVEVDGVLLGLWPDERALQTYGLSGDLAEQALERLTPHPWNCFTDCLHLRDPTALRRIPRALLNCKGTLERRPEVRRHRWSEGDIVETIDAPHDVMLTHPSLVADFLMRLVSPQG